MSNSHETLSESLKLKPTATIEFYQEWAKTYDQDIMNTNFNGPKYCQALCLKHLEPNMKILDIGAGTGVMSNLLKPHGFVHMDAHDGSSNMLQRAKDNHLYERYFEEFFQPGETTKQIPKNYYNALIMVGVFCPGHLDGAHLPQLLVPLRKDGIFIVVARKAFLETPSAGQSKSTKQVFDQLEEEKVWKLVDRIEFEKNIEDHPGIGLVYAMQS